MIRNKVANLYHLLQKTVGNMFWLLHSKGEKSKLAVFKDKHLGESCFIIGNEPSVLYR